jgi:SAM-dependent methyltransferase
MFYRPFGQFLSSALSTDSERGRGRETLERIADMGRMNAWMFHEIIPYIGNRILEVGSGIGTFSRNLTDRELLVCLDIESSYVSDLASRFRDFPNVRCLCLDASSPEALTLRPLLFDTIICLNVLEHIPDDFITLRHFSQLLTSKGRLILLVPAHRCLYGSLDWAISHFRRYSQADLVGKLSSTGFSVQRLFAINLLGIPGWFLNSRILKRTLLPERQLTIYERFVPAFRVVEALLGKSLGLSWIAIAEVL